MVCTVGSTVMCPLGKAHGRMPVARHALAVCSCTARHAAHSRLQWMRVRARVRVSVLIDSEPGR